MRGSKVTVIIPTYNGADHLGEAIQSVLAQTYPNFEIIVVNDASPDQTTDVVKQFDDPRLTYIVHPQNAGAVAARKTALSASSGEVIALLDQDDLYHPEKLEVHVALLESRPGVGVSYNGRFDIEGSLDAIMGIWQPPLQVSLADLVVSFPFAPSDTVFRRQWALREDIWDYSVLQGKEVVVNGGEYVYCGRLWFAGCTFAGIERALNYRRYHSGRVYTDLIRRCASELACQRIILDDPRCPAEVAELRNVAYTNTYLVWAYFALAQGETETASTFLGEALHLTPNITSGWPCHLVEFMIVNGISDSWRDHEAFLRLFFGHLPTEIVWLADQTEWAVARSYLMMGAKQVIWGNLDEGQTNLLRATERGAEIDETFIRYLTHQLLGYEREFGTGATQGVLRNLDRTFSRAGQHRFARWLQGSYAVNLAFRDYSVGNHARVPGQVLRAFRYNPRYLCNRGVLSILLRAISSPKR